MTHDEFFALSEEEKRNRAYEAQSYLLAMEIMVPTLRYTPECEVAKIIIGAYMNGELAEKNIKSLGEMYAKDEG